MTDIIVRYAKSAENPDVVDFSAAFGIDEQAEELYLDPEEFLEKLKDRLDSAVPLAGGMKVTREETSFWVTLQEGEKVYVRFELPHDPNAFAEAVQSFQPSTEGYGLMKLNEMLYSTSVV